MAGTGAFRIQWKPATDSNYSTTTNSRDIAANVGTHKITGLTPGTAYDVKVTSFIGAGSEREEDDSDATTATTALAVTVIPAAGSTAKLEVSWTAVSGAEEYLVQHQTGGGDFNAGTTVDAPATTHQLTGLTAGTAYTVRVTAKNTTPAPAADLAAGETTASTLAALAGLDVSEVAGDTTKLDVTWTAYTGAEQYRVQWRLATATGFADADQAEPTSCVVPGHRPRPRTPTTRCGSPPWTPTPIPTPTSPPPRPTAPPARPSR